MKVTILICGTLLTTAACGNGDETPEPPPSYPPLSKVVTQILRENPGWRLGTNEDCTNPSLQEKLRNNPTYQAYRAVVDINADGQRDRVFVIVKGDSGKFYWIPARDEGFGAPHLFASLDWIAEGGIVTSGRAVIFGRFDSDVAIAWAWNPSTSLLEPIPANDEPE